MRTVLIASLALVMPFAVAPAAAILVPDGERPDSGTCDATDLLVCAGADAGGAGSCTITPTGFASCLITYGFISAAWSPAGLAGDEIHVVTITPRVCSGVPESCSATSTTTITGCAWAPVQACQDGAGGSFPASKQLVLGECLQAFVSVDVVIDARATLSAVPLAEATFRNAGEDGGATCYVDDGRGT